MRWSRNGGWRGIAVGITAALAMAHAGSALAQANREGGRTEYGMLQFSDTSRFSNVPSDVHPESGHRLPLMQRDNLDDAGKAIYDRTRATAGTAFQGPGGIVIYSPKVAELIGKLNNYLRFESGLSPHLREVAILTVSREMENQFEWTGHEIIAADEGLDPRLVDIIRYRRPTKGLPEIDAVVIELGREALGKKKVSSATFARASALFEPRQLVDLVTLMGEYASVGILLTTFDMQLRPGWKPGLPATKR